MLWDEIDILLGQIDTLWEEMDILCIDTDILWEKWIYYEKIPTYIEKNGYTMWRN